MSDLASLVKITKGRKPSVVRSEPLDGDLRLLQIDDLRPGSVSKYTPHDRGVVIADRSDVVVAWDGANAGTSAYGLSGAIGSTLARLRPIDESIVSTPFLGHFIAAKRAHLRATAKGATIPHLDSAELSRLVVELPALDAQKRIAAILDQADAIRATRRQVHAHLDELTQAIFRDMFGDPISNRRCLPKAMLGSLATVRTGNSPSRAVAENFGDEIEWIKSDNLGGDVATRADESLSKSGMRRARIAPAGSILVTCIAGSARSIGKASSVDRAVAFNQQINAVLPSDAIDATFLLGQLKTSPELVQAKSTGGMKGLVNKTAFSSIEVLVPALNAQREYAQRVRSVVNLKDASRRALAKADELFASLQSRAFRGEL